MIAKKNLIWRLRRAIFGCFFGIIALFGLMLPLVNSGTVFAEGAPEVNTTVEAGKTEATQPQVDGAQTEETVITKTLKPKTGDVSCKDSLGELAWWMCPETSKVAEAVDWLREKCEELLVVNPVEAKDGQPIYEVWKYFKGVTNIVFIIFLLVVIYSHITGLGLNNYNIKKVLPKLIVAAVAVNLSFYVCALAVDVSNIIGQSLRGLLENIKLSTMSSYEVTEQAVMSLSEAYAMLGGLEAMTVTGAVISIESGAIWMLIPVVLSSVVAMASGLITIALRQAVIVLLIMISPLAFVAYILPNTEQWFKKWKQLFTRMLVFYPLFSLLFGAASLAGWAIMASAKDGFWLILGMAVQICPLFLSWNLLKMSGTFLGTINGKLRSLASKPIAANRAWADSRRQLTKQKFLASKNAYTPSLRLAQFLSNRKISREEEIREHADLVKARGMAYNARKNYDANGVPTREGVHAYEMQARKARYQFDVDRHKNNMNKGLGELKAVEAHASKARKMELAKLDVETVKAFDALKMEAARGAKIDFDNAKSFYERVQNAKDAMADAEAINKGDIRHKLHPNAVKDLSTNLERFKEMQAIMEGSRIDTNDIVADAAHTLSAQAQIRRGKYNDLFSYTGPTQDIVNTLKELSHEKDALKYIDPFVAGLKVLNMRGDTDLVRERLRDYINQANKQTDPGLILGTHATQALSNFLMFDVKDNDPFLRRFGKYINLETAAIYNRPDENLEGEALEERLNKRRHKMTVDMDEYVNGVYYEKDADGNFKERESKRSAAELLKGTSFKSVERTAFADMLQGIREASVKRDKNGAIIKDENGKAVLDEVLFAKNQENIWNAIMPNIVGDQFSYLSGSEQIIAFGKALTGMDSRKGYHVFDWNGIFGGENMVNSVFGENNEENSEQRIKKKKEFVKKAVKRTNDFLSGHVPSQLARSKSDTLDSIENLLVLNCAMKNDEKLTRTIVDKQGKERDVDFSVLEVDKISDSEYDNFKKKYKDEVSNDFKNMCNSNAVAGVKKMIKKGYQGESKNKLLELLGLTEEQLIAEAKAEEEARRAEAEARKSAKKNVKNNTGNQQFVEEHRSYYDDDDDDDGMPVVFDDYGIEVGGPTYNEHRENVEMAFREFDRGKHNRDDVREFWDSIKDECKQVQGKTMEIDSIETGLDQYTDVAQLYNRVINDIFDGYDK